MDKYQLIMLLHNLLKFSIHQVFIFENIFWWLIGMVAGISVVFVWVLRGTVWGHLSLLLFLITLLIQPVMAVYSEQIYIIVLSSAYKIPYWHLTYYLVVTFLTSIVVFLSIRHFLGSLDGLKDILIKKSALVRDGRTDVRTINEYLLPSKKIYDQAKYFNFQKELFEGLNSNNQPAYITKIKISGIHSKSY